jgi:hypothetical protein
MVISRRLTHRALRKLHVRCHSERSEESCSDSFLRLGRRAGFLAPLRRKSRHSRESGNPVGSPDVDPRLRGGDGLTFISVGGPQAHHHSE